MTAVADRARWLLPAEAYWSAEWYEREQDRLFGRTWNLPDVLGGFRPERLVEVARHRFELGANWKFFVENHVDIYHLWYLHADSLGAYDHRPYQCTPLAPDRSLVDLRVRAEPGSDPTEMLAMSRGVIEHEDGAACEAMQAAVRSPWFAVGPLARAHELPITWFHGQVVEALA